MRRADRSDARPVEAVVLDEALARLLDPLEGLDHFGVPASRDRMPVLAEVHAPRGTDVFTSVSLRARDVRTSVRPIVRFAVTECCPDCHGAGAAGLAGDACGRCGGDGVVEAERLLGLRIPAGVEDGADLRVRGEGNVPPEGLPGDLYVHVRVEPRTKGRAWILYLVCAAALTVLAVLAYLLFFT
jgi:DnaJ C terminal domain